MALNAACVFEFRTAGAATNGGGFKTGATGSDFSQTDSKRSGEANNTSVTDAVTNNTTTVTSANANFTSDIVGNVIYLSGSGTTTGWYEVTASADEATITVDRATGSTGGTGVTLNIGGAISTFQDAFFETLEPGNKVWVKAGAYSATEALVIAKDGTAAAPIVIEGYNSSRGDNPTGTNRPSYAGAGNNIIWDDYWFFKHLYFTTTNANGWLGDTGCVWFNCKVSGSGTRAITSNGAAPSSFVFSEGIQTGNSNAVLGGANANWRIVGSVIKSTGTSGDGITAAGAPIVIDTIFIGCAGTGYKPTGNSGPLLYNCTFFGAETPAGTGANLGTNGQNGCIINNIFYGWTTAITNSAVNDNNAIAYNNFFNNTTDRTNVTAGQGDIALDPTFTSAAGDDYSVGTNMKAAGFPGLFGTTTSTSYNDLGAVQRQEPASSGGASWFSGE